MPTAEKEQIVENLRRTIQNSKAAILTDYRGLSVADLTALRKKLREVDTEFHIVKNTLFKRAAEGLLPSAEIDPHLEGPTAIGFAKGDGVAAAKALLDYMKDHKTMAVKAGVIDGQVYDPAQVTAISKLPSKEQMVAEIVGALDAPAANLVGVLDAVIADLVYTIQAVAEQKAA